MKAHAIIFCPHRPQTTNCGFLASRVTRTHSAIATQECLVHLKCGIIRDENFGQVVPESRVERIAATQIDKRTISITGTVIELPGC